MTSPNQNNRKPNNLIREKSPYLLQHAYNPVNWFAWGDEAFQAARRENKPIFLSIGYSTCHWCHVMEKESFENEAIAAILNDKFVSIKVDREERPDIDQMYMLATQAMTGGGGWPMSVFLFADKKPFYAGTYFPPEPKYNHPGFSELLSSIDRAWKENREALAGSAEKITSFLANSSAATAAGTLDEGWSRIGFEALEQSYDKEFHGFGTNNKFPRPSCISFLQAYSRMKKDTTAFTMARDTLTSMAMGGMFDHVGGGFHRYSVDRQWRIPHFEKMLYDQAQLVISYVEMYQQTGESFFGQIAQQTVEYVLRDLQHPQGGFYSAEDADSVNPYNEEEHGEGAFYLWQESEIRELLGDDADIFIAFYGVRKDGNALQDPADEFSGRNILYMSQSLQELAGDSGKTTAELHSLLARSRNKLLEKRNLRSRPHLDDKIITAWNGLMISALSRTGRILGIERYSEEAERGVSFVMEKLYTGGTLLRRWRDGEGRFGAVLEDYAFLVQGLLDLYDATHKSIYLQQAQQLSTEQLELFADSEGGFYSSQASADILTRLKETYDGAEPSGNSVSALNFLRLGRILASDQWTTRAEQTIRAFGKILQEHGIAMPLMLTALELSLAPPVQIIIAGRREEEDSKAMLSLVNSIYLPQLQVLLADGDENQEFIEESIAYLGEVVRIDDKATAYLCKDFRCHTPTNDLGRLEKLIRELG